METPQEANKFLDKPDDFAAEIRKQGDASAREGVERVLEVLVSSNCTTYQDCVSWVRLHFQVGGTPAPYCSPSSRKRERSLRFCFFWRCWCAKRDARDSHVLSGVPRFSSVQRIPRYKESRERRMSRFST